MKTKSRKKSKNVEDARSPAATAMVSRANERDFPSYSPPSGPSYVPAKSSDVYRAKHDISARGPFKKMIEGMKDTKKSRRKK